MIAAILCVPSLLMLPGEVKTSAEFPESLVLGTPMHVRVTYAALGEGATLELWRCGPAAFDLDGQPLLPRTATGEIPLAPGQTIVTEFDLSIPAHVGSTFTLGIAGQEAKTVNLLKPAPQGTNYLDLAPADLARYQAMLQTDLGDLTVEFYPNEAPNHVRNFLDLCASGFYDGIGFHRVSPTFMIQGGCPNTKTENRSAWGTGNGPRQLDSEFNKIHHDRGILSMARSQNPNSASSQFFIITKEAGFLDNQYSVFGKLVSGLDALDKIAGAKGKAGPDGTVKPDVLPRIKKALVVVTQ